MELEVVWYRCDRETVSCIAERSHRICDFWGNSVLIHAFDRHFLLDADNLNIHHIQRESHFSVLTRVPVVVPTGFVVRTPSLGRVGLQVS